MPRPATGRSNSNTIISHSQTGLRLRFPHCLNRDVQMMAGINYKFEAGVDQASEVSKYSRDPAEDENLQKQSQNPVADLVSVPFKSNTNFNTGPFNRTQEVLNIQP